MSNHLIFVDNNKNFIENWLISTENILVIYKKFSELFT